MRHLLWLLLLPLLVGCAASGETADFLEMNDYNGEWREYTVNTVVARHEGRCVRREITMRRTAGLAYGYKPIHVWALDQHCDDRFERIRFRDDLDRQGFERHPEFADNILFAFYVVTPIPDQGR